MLRAMASTDWKEHVRDGEAARFDTYAAQLAAMQRARAVRAGKTDRALHAKANVGLTASFEVLADLPADSKHGLFATPATYQAVVRYSNGAGRRQPDAKPDVRGIAVKLLGVPGTKLIPGLESATTQDFLAIRTSSVPMRDADEFLAIVRAAESPALLPFKLIGALGFGRGLSLVRSLVRGLKQPNAPLAATSYYSALPIALGPHAVQFALLAKDAPTRAADNGPDALGEELVARVREQPVVYDFAIRFYADDATTPIEDASVEWSTPWVTVGRLTIAAQDARSPRGEKLAAWIETLSFDPWHALREHRPLGSLMRARNHAYRESTKGRGAAPEPTAIPR